MTSYTVIEAKSSVQSSRLLPSNMSPRTGTALCPLAHQGWASPSNMADGSSADPRNIVSLVIICSPDATLIGCENARVEELVYLRQCAVLTVQCSYLATGAMKRMFVISTAGTRMC
jgi:hypothetical protein